MKKGVLSLLFTSLASAYAGASPEALDSARSAVREWVEAEKALSREQLDWKSEKENLRDLIAVAETRVERLEEELEKSEESISAADERRTELLDREEKAEAKAARIVDFLGEAESGLHDLRPRLPSPLREEMAGPYQRLEDPGSGESDRVSERMQAVVALLTKIREFDGTVTVDERVRTLPGASDRQNVRTLWFGLGQAYYLAPEDAGYGVPGEEAWTWRSDPDLSGRINEAMARAEGDVGEPEWIFLPVRLDGKDKQ